LQSIIHWLATFSATSKQYLIFGLCLWCMKLQQNIYGPFIQF
jgi:hypothetical protein